MSLRHRPISQINWKAKFTRHHPGGTKHISANLNVAKAKTSLSQNVHLLLLELLYARLWLALVRQVQAWLFQSEGHPKKWSWHTRKIMQKHLNKQKSRKIFLISFWKHVNQIQKCNLSGKNWRVLLYWERSCWYRPFHASED